MNFAKNSFLFIILFSLTKCISPEIIVEKTYKNGAFACFSFRRGGLHVFLPQCMAYNMLTIKKSVCRKKGRCKFLYGFGKAAVSNTLFFVENSDSIDFFDGLIFKLDEYKLEDTNHTTTFVDIKKDEEIIPIMEAIKVNE